MHNDPELSGKYLGTISQDFIIVCDTLKEASYQMRVREITNYPIFPICKEDMVLGKLLVGKTEESTLWNYHISLLEEFSQRGLIESESEFIKNYKDPDEFCCLFVVDKDFTNFVYIPYPEDN